MDIAGLKQISIKSVLKVWGQESWIINDRYCLKILDIRPGFQCSLHRHLEKDETFIILEGIVRTTLYSPDENPNSGPWIIPAKAFLEPGDQLHVPPHSYHRFGSSTGATILEISTHHDDTDVERLEESGRLR